jgi:hypothetical protein
MSKRDSRPFDGMIVGLLLMIVIMMAYMIFMQPVRPPTPAPQGTATAPALPASPIPGAMPGTPGAIPGSVMASPGTAEPAAIPNSEGSPGAAGMAQAPGAAAAGSQVGAIPGRMGALHLREYLAGIVYLEQSGKLALSREQARALLPVLEAYARVADAIPTGRTRIVDTLTPAQRAWLEKNVPRSGLPSPDPHHTAEELLDGAVGRVLKANGGR